MDAADIYSLTASQLLETKKKAEGIISSLWDTVAAIQNLSEKQRPVIKRLTLQVISDDKEAQVVCARYDLTPERLLSLKDAVDQALPEVLKTTGVNQSMTWEHILTLNQSLGEKSVSNLLAAIEKSKSRPLNRVIFALGILHVGSEVAYLLARSFHSMDRLMNATEEDLLNIPAIGPRIAGTVVAYFQREENRKVVEKLRAAGVRLEDGGSAAPAEQPLAGMRFVVTGRLESFSRSQIEGKIKQLGGAVSSSVSRKTSYLVAGEDAGSKLADAHSLGVEVLSEDQFLAMIGNKAEQFTAESAEDAEK